MARVYWFAALWGPGLGGLTGLIFRLLLFFSREAHLGLLLIQLEFLSLLILGLKWDFDKSPFHPYFTVKDALWFRIFLFFSLGFVLWPLRYGES